MANVNAHLNSPPISPAKESPSRKTSLDVRHSSEFMARTESSSDSSRTLNGTSSRTQRSSPRPVLHSIAPDLDDDEEEEELEYRRRYTAGPDAFTSTKRSSVASIASTASRRRESYDGASTSASSTTLHRYSPSLTAERREKLTPARSPVQPLYDEPVPHRSASRADFSSSRERADSAAAERKRIRESLMQNTWTTPSSGNAQTIGPAYKRSPALSLKSSGGSGTYDSGSSGSKSRPGIPLEFRNALQSPYLSPSFSRDTLREGSSRASVSPVPTSSSSRGSGGKRVTRHPDRRIASMSEYDTSQDYGQSTRARKRSLLSEQSSIISGNQSVDSRDESRVFVYRSSLSLISKPSLQSRAQWSVLASRLNESAFFQRFIPLSADQAKCQSWLRYLVG
jgi:hypothetical protein